MIKKLSITLALMLSLLTGCGMLEDLNDIKVEDVISGISKDDDVTTEYEEPAGGILGFGNIFTENEDNEETLNVELINKTVDTLNLYSENINSTIKDFNAKHDVLFHCAGGDKILYRDNEGVIMSAGPIEFSSIYGEVSCSNSYASPYSTGSMRFVEYGTDYYIHYMNNTDKLVPLNDCTITGFEVYSRDWEGLDYKEYMESLPANKHSKVYYVYDENTKIITAYKDYSLYKGHFYNSGTCYPFIDVGDLVEMLEYPWVQKSYYEPHERSYEGVKLFEGTYKFGDKTITVKDGIIQEEVEHDLTAYVSEDIVISIDYWTEGVSGDSYPVMSLISADDIKNAVNGKYNEYENYTLIEETNEYVIVGRELSNEYLIVCKNQGLNWYMRADNIDKIKQATDYINKEVTVN